MPRTRTLQQRFTQGELDPRMIGRTDIDQYYSAAANMRDVFPIPQGGFTRRPGLEHIDRILRKITRITAGVTISAPNGGTGSNANDANNATELTTTTNISTTNPYVVVSYDLGSAKAVGMVRLRGLKLSTGTGTDFYVQTSTDGTNWTSRGGVISLTSSDLDVTRRVHKSVRYVRLARVGATDLGSAKVTLDEMEVWQEGDLSDVRFVDFEFNTDQSYMLVVTEGNIAVYREGEYQIDIQATAITEAMLSGLNWTGGGDTLILVQEDLTPLRIQRGTTDTSWTVAAISFTFIPKYDFVPATSNPAATLTPSAVEGTVTLTAGSSVFTSAHVNQYISANGGLARIVQYTSGTVVTAFMEIPFYNTTAIASGAWELQTGYEDVWSVTRGWPVSVIFYEGRLYFGGSKSRPRTIWASRVNLFFDFDPGTLLDDDAFERDIGGGQLNKIVNLYDGRNLMVFTTGGEFVALQTLGEPITPKNAQFKRQTSVGSEPGLRPQEVEGNVYFMQGSPDGATSVQSFVFNDTQQAFSSFIASLLSSHLIKAPVDFSLRKATSTQDGSYLLLVNNDGKLTVANVLASQNISSFVPVTTVGSFKRCGVDKTDMYVAVEREVNEETHYYIERFNSAHYMDASTRVTTGLPAKTFTGLDHLEGIECRVRADESNMVNRTPTAGSVTIERDAEESFEIGINFTPYVKDLPVELPQIGTALGMKKNISKITLQLYETSSITVNGKPQSFRKFGPAGNGSPLDSAPPLFTGVKEVHGVLGWTETAQVEISQVSPGPMTVLALSKRVNI